LAYKPYFFSQRILFFSYNKSANGTFSHGLSAKRTGQLLEILVGVMACFKMLDLKHLICGEIETESGLNKSRDGVA